MMRRIRLLSTKWLLMNSLFMILVGSATSFYIQSARSATVHHGTHRNHVNVNFNKSNNRRSCFDRPNHCTVHSHPNRVRANSIVLKLNDMPFPGTAAEAVSPLPSPPPKTIHSFWSQPRTREEIRRHCAQTLFPKEQYIHTKKRISVISSDLPLITIDNFLSPELCNDVIDAAMTSSVGMKPSTMGVSQQVSNSRTSSTLWLHDDNNNDNGKSNKALRVLAGKVSQMVGLDTSHMENLQVVKYEQGQKFDLHTDHLDSFNELDCKGRLATCLLYLNSSSDHNDYDDGHQGEFREFRGGCTYFPEYEAYITPKKGRAVFWFNTIERPGSVGYTHDMNLTVDLRSRHSGTPVYNGVKWVCNRWIHPIPLSFGVRGDDDDWCD